MNYTEYRVVEGESSWRLTELVQQLIKDGWGCQGGVSVTHFGKVRHGPNIGTDWYNFCQAMVR
jgi:hypothetical protein